MTGDSALSPLLSCQCWNAVFRCSISLKIVMIGKIGTLVLAINIQDFMESRLNSMKGNYFALSNLKWD